MHPLSCLLYTSDAADDMQRLISLFDERFPLYERYADIVIDEEGKDLEASLQAVLETLV